MRVVIFGANGPTGRLLTTRTLADGHDVVAVTRHPAQIPPRSGLTVAAADATDTGAGTWDTRCWAAPGWRFRGGGSPADEPGESL